MRALTRLSLKEIIKPPQFNETMTIRTLCGYFDHCRYDFRRRSVLSSYHRSHNLRKFPQIYAVSEGVVLVIIMRVLCILFKSLLLYYYQPPSPCRNKDMEISCESPGSYVFAMKQGLLVNFVYLKHRRPRNAVFVFLVDETFA